LRRVLIPSQAREGEKAAAAGDGDAREDLGVDEAPEQRDHTVDARREAIGELAAVVIVKASAMRLRGILRAAASAWMVVMPGITSSSKARPASLSASKLRMVRRARAACQTCQARRVVETASRSA
jgi:hypothetical protein